MRIGKIFRSDRGRCGRRGGRGAKRRGAVGSEQQLGWTLELFGGFHKSLVGGLEHFLFSHILGIIIPID